MVPFPDYPLYLWFFTGPACDGTNCGSYIFLAQKGCWVGPCPTSTPNTMTRINAELWLSQVWISWKAREAGVVAKRNWSAVSQNSKYGKPPVVCPGPIVHAHSVCVWTPRLRWTCLVRLPNQQQHGALLFLIHYAPSFSSPSFSPDWQLRQFHMGMSHKFLSLVIQQKAYFTLW